MDGDEELMVDGSQDILLHHDSALLFLLADVFLLHRLEGEQLSVALLPDQQHLSVGALSDHRQHGVVVQWVRNVHLLSSTIIMFIAFQIGRILF